MTNFKEHQLNDLGLSIDDGRAELSAELLQSGIQKDGSISDFNELAFGEHLTYEQKALLREIAERFSPDDSAADLSILYETTGFQAESDNL